MGATAGDPIARRRRDRDPTGGLVEIGDEISGTRRNAICRYALGRSVLPDSVALMTASSTDRKLRDTLLRELEFAKIEVTGRSDLIGTDETDPGTMDWWARVTLTAFDQQPDQIDWDAVDGAALGEAKEMPGEREFTIFEASGLRIDREAVGDVSEALDARSEDYAKFVPLFSETRSFGFVDLVGGLEDETEGASGEVLIIDRVRLAPAWRGLGGVGRLLTARVARWASSQPSLVAVHPFPIDLDFADRQDATVFDPAMERVRRVWESLAFKQFDDQIWVMNPILVSHSEAVQRLEVELGLLEAD